MEIKNFQEQLKSARQLKIEKNWKERLGFDNDEFKRQTGVDVFAIKDFRPKMAMLLFWSEGDQKRRQRIIDFAKEYKETGISAFVNFLENEKTDELILDIGEKAKPEDAEKIFQKISELASLVEKISDELAEAFIDAQTLIEEQSQNNTLRDAKNTSLRSIEKITSKINQILTAFREKLDAKKTTKDEIQSFLANLDRNRTEILMLSSFVSSAKEQGMEISPEFIKDLKLETREIGDGSEFSEEFKKTILQMAHDSYSRIYADNKKAYEKVMGKFKSRLENIQDFRAYMLTFKGKLAAFCTMQPTKENPRIVMAESLIADPEAQKSSAGMLFAKSSLDMELARDDVEEIQGETRTNNRANSKYKQVLGFEFEKDKNGKEKPTTDPETGVAYFKMIRKKKSVN